jgi:8-oxo-dGTP pyrophosphatase MutT (NUDIX family)
VTNDAALEQRLRRAVRRLDDPPAPPGWNHAEIADILGDAPRRLAAVLVPIVNRTDGPTVLFTLRTDNLAQHAGQISFPGGGMEPDDADAIAAALRETREEVGIAAELITPFGYLDTFETVSGYSVTPVVAHIDPAFEARPDAREVAAVFEAPLAHFLNPANLRRRHIDWRGRPREILEFPYHGRNIWGATAAMLLSLVRRMEAVT